MRLEIFSHETQGFSPSFSSDRTEMTSSCLPSDPWKKLVPSPNSCVLWEAVRHPGYLTMKLSSSLVVAARKLLVAKCFNTSLRSITASSYHVPGPRLKPIISPITDFDVPLVRFLSRKSP